MCSHKLHKSQQMHKNPTLWSRVNVSQQEEPFTMREEGLQDSCQAPFGLPGWHKLPLPSPPCWADLRTGWSWSRPCPPAPAPWVPWGAVVGQTQRLPQEIPKGQIKEERDISAQISPYCSLFRGSTVHLLHEITTYTLSLFPCFISLLSALLFILSIVDHLTFHGPARSKKKKLEFLIRSMQSRRFISSIVNQWSLKTLEQKMSKRYFAICYWCRVFPR